MYDDRYIDQLRLRFNSGEPLQYVFFWGHRQPRGGVVTQTCLSQWYAAGLALDAVYYRTAEHAMMAGKALLFKDMETFRQILAADTPGAVKALGRRVRGFDEAVWLRQRLEIVYRVNQAKFTQHEDLRAYLVATGDKVLVEASPKDAVWGIGMAAGDARIADPNHWPGLNLLGFALMRVREGLAGA
ncbi:NADAR family protein [Methylovulum psychrotolerans]|jgi:hypothetical protein|uniref:NADAR domain-containing protein n=1 Tax=Methylovulum psychrotolerans TaxID=1704499 RepID=A0A1Z4C425_9GAMM|nr:NADAR family protein [Methylovulum psychrotolerans]ASF48282.1 hypothetical protein CEK71_20675 [Methylovulum psychrotolerans]